MALEFEVDGLDSVDESLKSLYKKQESGKFRLDVTGIDPADELKGALANEREARRLANEKLSQYEEQRAQDQKKAQELERDALAKAGEWEKLYKLEQEQKQAALDESSQYKAKVQQKEIDLVVTKLASENAHTADLAQYLEAGIAKFVKHDGNSVVYEIDGQHATIDQVLQHASTIHKSIWKGSGMGGGGANGSGDGNGVSVSKAFDQMNGAELTELRNRDPDGYNRLRDAYRNKQ